MNRALKIVLNILGAVLVVVGFIWFFQGMGILPGSFMTGQARWAVNGGVVIGLGAILLLVANARRGA